MLLVMIIGCWWRLGGTPWLDVFAPQLAGDGLVRSGQAAGLALLPASSACLLCGAEVRRAGGVVPYLSRWHLPAVHAVAGAPQGPREGVHSFAGRLAASPHALRLPPCRGFRAAECGCYPGQPGGAC